MVSTWFPSSTDPLFLLARADPRALDTLRGRPGSALSVERRVVDHLRNEFTDYTRDRSTERHREACEAIAERFPHLAHECRLQVRRRHRAEQEAAQLRRRWDPAHNTRRDHHRALTQASRRAICRLSVGQAVTFRLARNHYAGTITKVGRSRVSVAYRTRTGHHRDRVRKMHAVLVAPLSDP
ncbi:hypothetical protein IDM40_26700 [Nocardiopsis sp. HNM0947]|uniref:Uncharacterized protein n=1 Tax=Nocardiopsis coralli TaxID=2772213 RepID=A0ABR9PEI4_9ACTN|nr:hypothetical protein [Nocardiopsis coralli]MBE3002262.1 hypothetical protein [Nocardiopsis coralli]